jgi:hypothetical protein
LKSCERVAGERLGLLELALITRDASQTNDRIGDLGM